MGIELPLRVRRSRRLPPGAAHQIIQIETVQELHLHLVNGSTVIESNKRVTMKINKSQKARNVGIQGQGDISADAAFITVSDASTNVDQGFESLLKPLIHAVKSAKLPHDELEIINQQIKTLRGQAAKPEGQRSAGVIKMALGGLKAAMDLVPGLSTAWSTIGKPLAEWFFPTGSAQPASDQTDTISV
jgi:hypothetical protein